MKKLSLILAALWLPHLDLLSAADTSPNSAPNSQPPPFPRLDDPDRISLQQIHITSESVSDGVGYQTLEEYTDFENGKSALVEVDKEGTKVTFINAQDNLIYQYVPYICQLVLPSEILKLGMDGIWTKLVKVDDKSSKNVKGEPLKQMHLYGVAALWLNAADLQKTYQSTELVYSASRDMHVKAHKWTVEDQRFNQLIHLYFLAHENSKPSLEMIQIESKETLSIVRTINLLSVDFVIPESVYDTVLQVPVGFGCASEMRSSDLALVQYPQLKSLYLSGPLLAHSHRLELEVTATKYPEGDAIDSTSAKSDTINIEMVHTNIGTHFSGIFQMVRQKSSTQNTKVIIDHTLKVQQKIDMRTGSCEITNILGAISDKAGLFEEETAQLTITFSNGLTLSLSPEYVKKILVDLDDFHYVKTVSQGSDSLQYLYFEQASELRFNGHQTRIVRVYSLSQPMGTVELESVTIWTFDSTERHLMESYHLNVIDAIDLESDIQETVKLFDVSEECYLNNEQMKINRDYAWLEVFYPLVSAQGNLLAPMENQVKMMILSNFLRLSQVSITRIPKIEVMLEETGMIVRLLLLDIPSPDLAYDMIIGSTIELDPSKGEVEQLAVDLRHCADYCKLNLCASMSYCSSDHTCLVSRRAFGSGSDNKLVRNAECKTFVLPGANYGIEPELFLQLSLHRIVSDMQHTDYQSIDIPQMPEELIYPQSETGIDDKKLADITSSYSRQVIDFLKERYSILPTLALLLLHNKGLFILIPSKVQLEQDPLELFGLAGDQSLDQENPNVQLADIGLQTSTSAFREGLNFRRFNKAALAELNNGDTTRYLAQPYIGISYDQCALACIDGRCSSFSYCKHREECIITNIYNLNSLGEDALEKNLDCFISQRNFVAKFDKFQNVYRPNSYKSSSEAINPSECAHTCMVESNFNCLAFDYCEAGKDLKQPMCFYQEKRALQSKQEGSFLPASASSAAGTKPTQDRVTGCDHYSRSYLADFIRIEYRQVEKSALDKMKTSVFEGKSVDQCAELCAIELSDCSAFQLCLNTDPSAVAMQTCTMIQSKPEGAQGDDLEAVLDDSNQRVIRAGKLLTSNQNCHVFSLRPDSNEAHLRDLVMSSLTTKELEDEINDKVKPSKGGLSVGGAIFLYLSMTLVFAAVGCGILLMRQHNSFVAAKIERIQVLLGL